MKKIFFAVVPALCIGLVCTAFAENGGQGGALTPPAVQEVQPESQASLNEPSGNVKEDEKKAAVARVNGVDISRDALDYIMLSEQAKQGRPVLSPEEGAKMRKDALDRLIFEELAYQKATAEGLKADPAEIDKRIADLKVQYGGADVLKKKLEEKGVTEEDLRAAIARGMVLQRIFKREIEDKVPAVTEDEIKKAYEKAKDAFPIAEKVLVNDMVFFLDPDKEESVQQVRTILRKLQDGSNTDPKSLPLDGTFIVQEIELSKLKEPQLYDEAKKLKVGEYSGVIKTSDSLHIIQLKEYSPVRQYTLDEMRGFLADRFRQESRLKITREWEEELKKGAKIEILDAGKDEAAGNHK
jgi:parvulin-like peptidyl-prolyl isomerase